MIIKSKEFKECCATIAAATSSNELSTLTETLELKTEGKTLFMNVTNREYYATVKFDLGMEEDFHATVNAQLFLKLINATTTEDIEMVAKNNYIEVKANGTYKLPMIFEDDKLIELPEITIDNKTVEMKVSGTILQSILNFNMKELEKGTIAKPVQKMFYVDNEGCITFTSGACVNSFELEQPIKVLLNQRTVKLFKLFKDDMVDFTLGYDPVSDTLIQTKVSFETPKIKLTAITGSDDTLLASVPVAPIRNRANNAYAHSVVFNRAELSEAIARLILFTEGYGSRQTLKPYGLFSFAANSVTVYDPSKENNEVVKYAGSSVMDEDYEMTLDLKDFKTVLDSCTESVVTVNFGDHKAAVVVRGSIKNVIPECVSKR